MLSVCVCVWGGTRIFLSSLRGDQFFSIDSKGGPEILGVQEGDQNFPKAIVEDP